MRADIFYTAATLLASGTNTANALNLKSEHAGSVISRVHGSTPDGILHNGTASGRTVSLGNGMLLSNLY